MCLVLLSTRLAQLSHGYGEGCRVGGKISDSNSDTDLSKFSDCDRGGYGSGVLESTPAGLSVFFGSGHGVKNL